MRLKRVTPPVYLIGDQVNHLWVARPRPTAVALGMGRAMDIWLMTRQPDDDALPSLIRALAGCSAGPCRP